jgi:hypothetical protein
VFYLKGEIMEAFAKAFGLFVLLLVIVSFVALVIGLPVMWIVNYLFTQQILMAVFGVPQLTFWKAFWIANLTGLLFKSTTTNTNTNTKKEK